MMTAPPKTSPGCVLTSSSQGVEVKWSATSGARTVWHSSFLAKKASRYDFLMLTSYPPS